MRDQENSGWQGRQQKLSKQKNGRKTNSIFLFGEFRMYNRAGEDVVPQLPRKLQELFLMILTSSFTPFSFTTIKTINTYLWPDQTIDQAKNNRNVSLNKLRKSLEEIDGLKICCEHKSLWIELDEHFSCDYQRALDLLSAKVLNAAAVKELALIFSRGKILSNFDFDWFEDGRGKIIDTALHKFKEQLQKHKDESELSALIAESILQIDPLSESALKVKLQDLVKRDEHAAARAAFEHFKREYHLIYGVDYKKSIAEMMK